MTADPKKPSEYFKDFNENEWETIFETPVSMAVKSKIENAKLILIPNVMQTATLIFKKDATIVLTTGQSPQGPVVNFNWENKLLISQNMETRTGN